MKRETDQYMMFAVLELHCTMYGITDDWLEIVGVVALYAMLFVMLTKLLKFKRKNGKIEI